MTKFLVLMSLLVLASCGRFNRFTQGITGDAVSTCQNGISYLQFESGVSVEYSRDGLVKKCDE